jgi:hypothetical protein
MRTMQGAMSGSVVLLLATVLAAGGNVADFSRYQVIVDKNLFGEPVAVAIPPAAQPQQPPARSFAETLRVSGVIQERDGAWVALVDVGSNPNKSSLAKVGEENADGVTVVQADVEGGKVLLKKGDEEKWLSLDQTPAAAPAATRSTLPGPAGFMRTPASVPTPSLNPVNPSVPTTTSATTLAERMKARREALERAKAAVTSPPPPAAAAPTNTLTDVTPQERMKKLREYNLDLIRAKGLKGPPLPIPLSPEEDEQLVKEGVLPPQTMAPAPAQ